MAGNSKDVVIRFVGQNLVGPAAHGAIRDANSVRQVAGRAVQTAIGGAAGKFGGGLVSGGAAGIIGGAALIGRLLPAEVRALPNKILDAASERIAAAFGIVTKKMEAFGNMLHSVSQKFILTAGQTQLKDVSALRASQAKLFGRDVEPGEDKPLFGGLFGHSNAREKMYRQAIEQSREQRRKLHLDINPDAQRAAVARLTAEAVQRMHDNDMGTGRAGGVTERDIERARANARRAVARQADRTRGIIESNVRDEAELFSRRRWERGIANFGRQVNIGVGGTFNNARGFLGGQAQGLLGQAQFGVGQMLETMRMNMAMREQTRSPAEQLSDQLAELRGMQHRLTPENFARRRRQLLMQGIAGLDDKPFNRLSATESRTLTRGPDQKPQDELKRILHQDNEEQNRLLREMLDFEKSKGRLDVVVR